MLCIATHEVFVWIHEILKVSLVPNKSYLMLVNVRGHFTFNLLFVPNAFREQNSSNQSFCKLGEENQFPFDVQIQHFLLHGLLAPYHIRFKHVKLTFSRLETAIDSSIFTSSPHISYDVDFR